jgi:energy-coupling factor transporter ATP-binding protein EcfA2
LEKQSASAQIKTDKYTFWKMYVNYGLDGKILNFFRMDLTVITIILFEFVFNLINSFTSTKITKVLMSFAVGNDTSLQSNIILEFNTITSILIFMLMLFWVIFSFDTSEYLRYVLSKKIQTFSLNIIKNIQDVVINKIQSAPFEIDNNYGISEKDEMFNSFNWTYNDVTMNLVDICIQIARSITFCIYIMYYDPKLIIIIIIMYGFVWKILPYLNQEAKKKKVFLWESCYYSIYESQNNKMNPLYQNLYCNNNDPNLVFPIEIIGTTDHEFQDSFNKGNIVKPDIIRNHINVLRYYNQKRQNWDNKQKILSLLQNGITFILICLMIYQKHYETAITMLINRTYIFGIISAYNFIISIEKNSERSLEKITKILKEIDDFESLNERYSSTINIIDEKKDHIKSVHIKDLIIPISNSNNEISDSEETKCINFEIVLDESIINYENHRCLLLEGGTGCGKSTTIKFFAGLYTKSMCKEMKISLTDGKIINKEFNSIPSSRCYVSQLLSEEFKYNNKIKEPMYKMFPGANDIKEISEFLQDIFDIKSSCIPEKITDHPHKNLSGGEVQRYTIASQIWRIKKVKPDCVILDEIDRALDKKTACKIMNWIIDNVDSFFVIVTHLTEVKELLMNKKCVSQIWKYDSINSNQIKINPEIIQ